MDIMDEVHCHIWIHCLLTTKDENPIIQSYFKEELLQTVEDEFLKMNCEVRIINSSSTHLNCLFKLNPEKSIQDVIDQIKEVSNTFNESQEQAFWDEGFSSLTVDPSGLNDIFEFIRDQEIRHLKEPHKSEFKQLLELHKVEQ